MDLVQFPRVECWEGRRVDTNQRREKRNNGWGSVRVAYRDQENATRPTQHVWRDKKTSKLGWNFHQWRRKCRTILACSTADADYPGFGGESEKVMDAPTVICYYLHYH